MKIIIWYDVSIISLLSNFSTGTSTSYVSYWVTLRLIHLSTILISFELIWVIYFNLLLQSNNFFTTSTIIETPSIFPTSVELNRQTLFIVKSQVENLTLFSSLSGRVCIIWWSTVVPTKVDFVDKIMSPWESKPHQSPHSSKASINCWLWKWYMTCWMRYAQWLDHDLGVNLQRLPNLAWFEVDKLSLFSTQLC